MRRYAVPAMMSVAAAAVLALLVFGVASQGVSTSLDSQLARGIRPPAPDAHKLLPGLGSSPSLTIADLRGEVVVVNFFASWCQPCQAESPILESAQRKFAKYHATILGVTYDDTVSDAEGFIRQQHVTYPVVRDVTGSLARAYGADGIPETFVIDRQGRVAALEREQIAGNWLQSTLSRVIGTST